MSKSIKVIRTFPRAWYKFIVEGEVNSLPKSERLIAESALSKAFPDGGDIIATKMDKGSQKFSSLVCESYSVKGLKDKTEGKTFKVKVLASAEKNPKTFKKYVSEGIEELRKKRSETDFDNDDSGAEEESDLAMVSRLASGSPDYADSGDLAAIAHSYDEWKKLFGTSLTGRRSNFGGTDLKDVKVKPDKVDVDPGVKTENLRQGAEHLKEEIVKAFKNNDKERLVALRSVLPVLAVDISKDFVVNRLVGEFSTETGSGGKSETEFSASVAHAMIQSIAVIYNDAFDLPDDNPFAEKADEGSEVKVYKTANEILGDKAKAYADLKKNLKDGKIDRAGYAQGVIDKVLYGEKYAEKMVKDVTGAEDSVFSNKARVERSEIRRSVKTLTDWLSTSDAKESGVTGAIDSRRVNMSESDYEYAKIQALLSDMRKWIGQIDDAFMMVDAIDGDITMENVLKAYVDQATTLGESVVSEAADDVGGAYAPEGRADRVALFKQILKQVWTDRGLSENEPYNGTVEDLKDSVDGTCEAFTHKVNEIVGSLRKDFADYKEQRAKYIQDKRNGKLDPERSKPFNFDFEKSPTFTDGENSGDYRKGKKDMTPNANMEWLRANICSNRWRNLQMVKAQMQKQLDGAVDKKAQVNQMSQAQSDFLQSGERSINAIDRDDYDSGDADERIEGGEKTDADREVDDIDAAMSDEKTPAERLTRQEDFDKMSEKFVGLTPVKVRQHAKFLHLNPDRALMIHDWWCKVTTCPGGLPEYLGFLADGRKSADVKRFNDIKKEIQGEINKEENERDERRGIAITNSKDTLKELQDALKEEQDKLAKFDEEKEAFDKQTPSDTEDDAKFKQARMEAMDIDRQKIVDSINELKKLVRIFREESKNPTGKGLKRLSRHEKDLIATRIIGPTDMTSPLEVYGSQDDFEHHARGVSKNAQRLGVDTLHEIIRQEVGKYAWSNQDAECDTDKLDDSRYGDYLLRNNTYRGYPDLLVLLCYDKVADAVYENEEIKRRAAKGKSAGRNSGKSFEDCVLDTIDPLYIAYQRFLVRKLKLERISMLGDVVESADDKYLVTVDSLLDLIEKSDIDAQKKLDMLEVVEIGFKAWCDQNNVVPQAVNPADDEDAVANHPEDEESSEDDTEA